MKKIIRETEAIAYEHLKAFGFPEEQITPLVDRAKKDLQANLTKLEILLHEDTISIDEINNVLHALKGLLFNLGNHALAEKLNEIRSHLESDVALKEISQILFDET
ncbi:hypothetical protein YH65_01775 [Sulfurovum lithotrophicum]|uniref:HPt domain-containing protein n=1 Tax=Sulfurovum lithotrophicum TaxID=206403 RepID=A0A7U4LZT5_9BACT|nr:hypothetical protein [Sulfurovum lithotrophicum]AKF24263.1 hypothetical protein YH65_01775 [Sulfurovum lithotrophicum]